MEALFAEHVTGEDAFFTSPFPLVFVSTSESEIFDLFLDVLSFWFVLEWFSFVERMPTLSFVKLASEVDFESIDISILSSMLVCS